MARRIAFVANALSGRELQAGKSDTSRVHAAMLHPDIGACDPSGPAPLHDCPSRGVYQEKLLRAVAGWQQEHQLILYFSGHGKVVRGKYSLLFGDQASEPVLPFDNIINDLNTHGVTRAILILDACESGAIVEGIKGPARYGVDENDLPRGIAFLASSRRKENSHELDDGTASLFTHLLIEGLENGLGDTSTDDDLIGVGDIYRYIKRQMSTERYRSFPQTPVFSIDGAEREIWIARNKARKTAKTATAASARSIDELRFLYEQTANSRHPCAGATSAHLNRDHVATFSKNAGMGELDFDRFDVELQRLGLCSPIQPDQLHIAAVLCFAHRPQVFLPQARSILVIGSRKERGFQRQDVLGPLPDQYRALVDGVEATLARQGMQRDSMSQLFFSVVREAISNAIAHRDHARNGAVRVSVAYPTVEVVSPGGFPGARSWRSLLHGEHVSNPVDAAIAWYLTTVLAFEGVGRGFEVFEEYIALTSDSHLECDEIDGASIRLRITLYDGLPRARVVAPLLPSTGGDTILPVGTESPSLHLPPVDTIRGIRPVARSLPSTGGDTIGPADPADAPPAPRPPRDAGPIREGAQLGRYELVQQLGQGGAGAVYRGLDRQLKRDIAIKILPRRFESSRYQERFLREAAITARLVHPGIVSVYDIGTTDDQIFVVMQLVEGGTLNDWIRTRAANPATAKYFHEVAAMVAKVAEALAYAHANGVIHRDVKPHNILVDGEGRPLIADFGIAKSREQNDDEASLTLTGEIFGTPRYMSPEQMYATGDVDSRTDIFSLGVVLWEMLARKSPFEDLHRVEQLFAARNRDLPPPRSVNSKVPRELNAICVKATRMDPKDRYQLASEVAHELNAFVRDA